MASVGSFEYAAAAERETAIFADEVNVVNSPVRAQAAFDPTCASVISECQEATVTADPAAFRIAEVNGIQVLSPGDYMRAGPPALWVAEHAAGEKAAPNGQHSFEARFPNHRLNEFCTSNLN